MNGIHCPKCTVPLYCPCCKAKQAGPPLSEVNDEGITFRYKFTYECGTVVDFIRDVPERGGRFIPSWKLCNNKYGGKRPPLIPKKRKKANEWN